MANVKVICTVLGALGKFQFQYQSDPPGLVNAAGDIDLSNINGTVLLEYELVDRLSDGSVDFDDDNRSTTDNFWVRRSPEKPNAQFCTDPEFSDPDTPGKKKTKIKNKNSVGSGSFLYSMRFLGSDGAWYESDPIIINRAA
jgi:hypothetical protein